MKIYLLEHKIKKLATKGRKLVRWYMAVDN